MFIIKLMIIIWVFDNSMEMVQASLTITFLKLLRLMKIIETWCTNIVAILVIIKITVVRIRLCGI